MDSDYLKQSGSFQSPRPVARRQAIAMCLFSLSLGACDKPNTPTALTASATPQLALGKAFPPFMLDFISSESDAAPSLRGKMLVLNIWATWCPPCRREMPSLELLSKTLDPKRFAVIGLSVDSDALLATEFLAQNKITFANFFDKNGNMSRKLGLTSYPETLVISPDRALVLRKTGFPDWGTPEMVSTLERLYRAQPSVNVKGMDARK